MLSETGLNGKHSWPFSTEIGLPWPWAWSVEPWARQIYSFSSRQVWVELLLTALWAFSGTSIQFPEAAGHLSSLQLCWKGQDSWPSKRSKCHSVSCVHPLLSIGPAPKILSAIFVDKGKSLEWAWAHLSKLDMKNQRRTKIRLLSSRAKSHVTSGNWILTSRGKMIGVFHPSTGMAQSLAGLWACLSKDVALDIRRSFLDEDILPECLHGALSDG